MTSVNEAAADVMVTCPPHYQAGPYECKKVEEAISEKMTETHSFAFNASFKPYQARLYFAAFEYLWRAPFKNGVQDLEKCVQDLQELVGDLKDE